MCGIVGYIGNGSAQEVLLNGLERLEYRGYDSAGVYVVDGNGQNGHLFREEGRIAKLQSEVDMTLDAHTGIGHTRWATHGEPSVRNAHPHQSSTGRFTLVHNGVIENYREMKEDFLSDVTFHSDTDTEVAVNLIEHFALTEGLDAETAFLKALNVIEGSYAFALIDSEQPGVVFAAKNKSPLLIGKGTDFNTIVSDAMASIDLTDQYVEIHDGEMVILTEENVTIKNLAGETIERAPYTAQLDANDLDKGTYPYYMIKEIDEQPAVMRRIIQEYSDDNNELTVDQEIIDAINASDRIYIIGAGTSMHAGLVGKNIIEKMVNIPVEVHVASEFAYNMPVLSEKPFFIYLTQSGETADSRQVLVQTNKLGYKSLTITNVKGSTLSREADYTLLLHAGPEIAVASTKAYTGQIAVMAVLAEALRRDLGFEAQFDMEHELSIIANAIQVMIDDKDEIHELATELFTDKASAFYIGRGIDYEVSREAALKIKEISYIQAEGFASGELKHGTISLIEDGTPVVGVITQENTAAHSRGNIEEVRSRGANTLIISMDGLDREGDDIVIPSVEPLLSALVSVIPTQLLAYYASLDRGLDVDKPRNLAKSVTVE
ncbi:glutamine---fructose-6-phosphate transaminase (isomerizing) [Aerococcus sp. 150760007-1]|uniref:Glutamine--fructose-6-phosphate aminotransferase [isomerizing] n=1 Tax=Aerococcus urinaeequi TaxID=51665 RepID=A0ABR5ZZW5_9LACT|nr:glutamine--fructose-6-phosphate transaminase (isomerizing) [Aerococcus urinaeequi]MBA5747279.1 glutamine--fructose-6-phosphate transaminase (isomerizing) [Aerococcus urinaeequi]MBA5830063.1 glutamine--fructose-6-phosphate transaminase (isomerizing) [Aerococcus urinaeequi]MBA5860966.1 glutamine--fructose-6-phosphate transaminase (isomerizing) [Aerococcus urinaeequi]